MEERLKWITKYNEEHNDEYKNFTFSGKYLVIKNPNHPKARKDGYVYIHQIQAEKKIGRLLNEKECVHHIDENKYNNDEDNLMVFATVSDHSAFHKGDAIHLENDVWVADNKKDLLCPVCKKNFMKSNKVSMCLECYKKQQAKNIPPKEELEKLIYDKNNSFVSIGKMYGVTDSAVKKWCKKYNLPYRKKDIVYIEY